MRALKYFKLIFVIFLGAYLNMHADKCPLGHDILQKTKMGFVCQECLNQMRGLFLKKAYEHTSVKDFCKRNLWEIFINRSLGYNLMNLPYFNPYVGVISRFAEIVWQKTLVCLSLTPRDDLFLKTLSNLEKRILKAKISEERKRELLVHCYTIFILSMHSWYENMECLFLEKPIENVPAKKLCKTGKIMKTTSKRIRELIEKDLKYIEKIQLKVY